MLGALAAWVAGTLAVLVGIAGGTIGDALLFQGASMRDALKGSLVLAYAFHVVTPVAGTCVGIPLLVAGLPLAWALRRAGHATRAKLAALGALVGAVSVVVPPLRAGDDPAWLGLAAVSGAVSGLVLRDVAWPPTPKPRGCERASDR